MNKEELDRLRFIEQRIKEIALEIGLLTTEIAFEVVPAKRMLEGMAYMFPSNFSHWSFGRDYEKFRTIYEHSGMGIPYEQVWNFDKPRALIVETSPFVLKVLTVAHVYGHVDYFLANIFLQHGRLFSDIAEEASGAARRFKDYEIKYGKEEVEKTIEVGKSIEWQQHPDPLFEEELDVEILRERVVTLEREKIRYRQMSGNNNQETKKTVEAIERKLRYLSKKTPPMPIYDLLGYIIQYSSAIRPWQKDILSVIRNQARALAPLRHTKMLDEGWATYCHVQIMRRLFQEGLLSKDEHGVFNDFHSRVTQESKATFNWYGIGLALFERIKEWWDKGRFGQDYENCENPDKKAYWDTGAKEGTKKIFKVRAFYSDRMAIEEFFTDDFIREMRLYIYQEDVDPNSGDRIYSISEDDPRFIRRILKGSFALHGIQLITIEDSNYHNNRELYLDHSYLGLELEPQYRDGTMRNLNYLWGGKIHLETIIEGKRVLRSFDGKNTKNEQLEK